MSIVPFTQQKKSLNKNLGKKTKVKPKSRPKSNVRKANAISKKIPTKNNQREENEVAEILKGVIKEVKLKEEKEKRKKDKEKEKKYIEKLAKQINKDPGLNKVSHEKIMNILKTRILIGDGFMDDDYNPGQYGVPGFNKYHGGKQKRGEKSKENPYITFLKKNKGKGWTRKKMLAEYRKQNK